MSRYVAASLLLALAVAAIAAAPDSPYEEARQQDKRTIPMSDASHLDEAEAETERLLAAEGGATLAAIWAAKKDMQAQAAKPLEVKPSGGVATLGDDDQSGSSGGGVATQGDYQSSSGGGGASSGSGEHGKEEGSIKHKEGEKQGKSCLTKEECHKKKMLCGKGCTLSAHTKCAAKCTKSCVPTC